MSAAPLSPIALRRIAEAIETGAQLSQAELREAADALRKVRKLMLPPSNYAERVALIRDCHQRFFANLYDREAAREIAIGSDRYKASGWSCGRERDAEHCPPRLIGTPQEFYWRILRVCPELLGAESIRKLLRNQ